MRKSFASELREEWSEPVDECSGLFSPIEPSLSRSYENTMRIWA
jgi:hypothetical protein